MSEIDLAKTCAKCKTVKPWSEFGLVKGKPYSYCKLCVKAIQAKRYADNKEKIDARNKAYALSNPERMRAIQRRSEAKHAVARAERRLAWQRANPEKVKAQNEKWDAENPGERLAAGRRWYARNIEKVAAKDKAYREANYDKCLARERAYQMANPEKRKAKNRAWGQANKAKVAAFAAKRRNKILQRTPAWLTFEDYKRMEFIYECARITKEGTGVAYEVDPIYPLQGKYVSGLHVPENLQLLTASENRSKNNRWKPE